MLRRSLFWFGGFFTAALLGLGFFIVPVNAANNVTQSGIITVTGIVPPAKYVYIDANQTIKQIISNTPLDADPVFLTDSSPAHPVSPTTQLLNEYEALKAKYNFSHQGVVYDLAISEMTAVGLQKSLPLSALSSSTALTVASNSTGIILSFAN